METIKLENDLNNKLEINNNLKQAQNIFLESALGKVINNAIDIGVRSIFPDLIEESIIDIKDNLLNYGIKDGINKTINDSIELGKSAIGLITGNFENISQMENVIKSGGIIDGVSILVDTAINKAKESGVINSNIAKGLKQGKGIILNNLEKNIEKNFKNQEINFENINNNIQEWRKCFDNKDFNGMQKEFMKIEKQKDKLVPIQKILDDINLISNLQELIKNNGQDFNLSSEELELINKLK